MSNPVKLPFKLTGPKVLMILVGFFCTIFVVDGIMAYVAISTFSGLDEHDPFRAGLKYNQRIAEERRQDKRGWQDTIKLDSAADELNVKIIGRDGTPIEGLTVQAKLLRPTTNVFDHDVTLAAKGNGLYQIAVPELKPGGWIVELSARQSASADADVVFRAKARVCKETAAKECHKS